MNLGRRLAARVASGVHGITGGPDESEAGPAPGPTETPPPGRPTAAFAGVLDGRSLWVAVAAQPGSLALRPSAPGEAGAEDVVPLPDGATDDQPGWLGARLDLTALPGDHAATYDVVLVRPGTGGVAPVWTSPLPEATVPADEVRRVQHTLTRGEDGTLRVRREPMTPAAVLRSVSTGPDGAHLRLTSPAPAGDLVALAADGAVLATWPTERAEDSVGVTVTVAPLDGVDPQPVRLVLANASGEEQWTVRRLAHGLPDPGIEIVPLPLLHDADGRPRLQLLWSADGRLLLRVPEGDAT